MVRSDDDLIRIDVIKNLSHVNFPASDGSIMPAVFDEIEHKAILWNLFNSPADKHLTLLLPRVRRSQTMQMLDNVAKTQNWNFLDIVNICYEKTTQSNASSFVRNSEPGFLFFKGDYPNLEKSKWFNPEYSNATTTWGISPQPEETIRASAYMRFSWELMLILVTLAQPLHYGRFIYGLNPDDDNILQFAAYHRIPLQLYTEEPEKAEEILQNYNHIKENFNKRKKA